MRFKLLSVGGIAGILLILLVTLPLTVPTFVTTYSAAMESIKANKQAQAERDQKKRHKYLQSLPTDGRYLRGPAKVMPNVRDLPD